MRLRTSHELDAIHEAIYRQCRRAGFSKALANTAARNCLDQLGPNTPQPLWFAHLARQMNQPPLPAQEPLTKVGGRWKLLPRLAA